MSILLVGDGHRSPVRHLVFSETISLCIDGVFAFAVRSRISVNECVEHEIARQRVIGDANCSWCNVSCIAFCDQDASGEPHFSADWNDQPVLGQWGFLGNDRGDAVNLRYLAIRREQVELS